MHFVWLFVLGLWLMPTWAEAACPRYVDVVMDTRGNIIPDASISVYISGTNTLATLYTTSSCTTVTSNPVTSDASGVFSFYIKDATVDMTFSKTGFTFQNLTDVKIFAPFGENVVSIGEYTTTDICETSTGAIDAIGSTVTTLVINKPAICSLDKTIPSTLSLRFEGQGTVTVASGKTLTVNGPVFAPAGRAVWAADGTLVWGSASGPNPYGLNGIVTPTYDTSVDINVALGQTFIITVTDGNNFTMEAPSANFYGCIKIRLKNSSGGAVGTITWNAIYKKPTLTSPANGFQRTYPFCFNGTNWVFETDDADTPN